MATVMAADTSLRPGDVPGLWNAEPGHFRASLAGWRTGRPTTLVQHHTGARISWQSDRLDWLMGNGSVIPVVDWWQTDAEGHRLNPQLADDGTLAPDAFLATGPIDDEYRIEGGRLKHTMVLPILTVPEGAVKLLFRKRLYLWGCALPSESGRTAGGIPLMLPDLPPGVMEFERGEAEDEAGNVTHTAYEWETVGPARRAYLTTVIDAEWLRVAQGRVSVDPSVVVAGSTATDGRRIVQLAGSRQVSFVNTANGVVCEVSEDNGLTWNACTSPTNGLVCANTNAFVVSDPDADGTIHLLVGSNSATQPLYYVNVQVSGLTATVVQTQVEAAAGTNYYWGRHDLVVAGAAGASKTLTMNYVKVNVNAGSTQTLYARTATVTTAGVLTLNTRSTIASGAESGERYVTGLSKQADGTVKLFYQDYASNQIHVVSGIGGTINNITLTGSGQSLIAAMVGVDGFSQCLWIGRTNSGTQVWNESGLYATISGTTYGFSTSGNGVGASGDAAHDRIVLFAKNSTTSFPKRLEFTYSTKAVTDKGDLNSTIAVGSSSGICSPRTWQNRIPILYSNGTNIYSDNANYNNAPQEPTITAPTTFDTPSGLTFTVTRNDTDAGDLMTGVYVKIGSQWWNGSALVGSEPGTPIAVSPAAASTTVTIPGANFTVGQTYQIAAATVDTGGAKGPYNATPIPVRASTKPTYSQTYPTSGATVTALKTRVQGAQTCASGASPASYIVRQYAADGVTPLVGPVTAASPGALNYEIQYAQTSSLGYQTGVIPVDSDGLQGDEVKTPFTVSFLPPPAGTVTPSSAAPNPWVTLAAAVPAPGAGEVAATSVRFERSPDGGATVQAVATANVAAGAASATDWAAAAGQTHWRAVTIADNGVETAGAWVPVTLSFDYWWYVPLDGVNPVAFVYQDALGWRVEDDVQVAQTQDEFRQEYQGPTFARLADISARFADRDGLTARQWRERLIAHAKAGTAGYLKSPVGDVYVGTLRMSNWRTNMPSKWEDSACTFRQTGEVA